MADLEKQTYLPGCRYLNQSHRLRETENTSQIEHAMAAAVSKIEAIDPSRKPWDDLIAQNEKLQYKKN
jgi:hypothetical protein